MNISMPASSTTRVLATVDATNRSGRSMVATTLVLDGPTSAPFADIEAAITASQAATEGAAQGAVAVLRTSAGFVTQDVRSLADGSDLEIERSRAKRTFVTGQMDVYATDVVAIVDGRRIERMPDYSRATPESWQDRRLVEVADADGSTKWGFSAARSRYARTDASHFTPLGADLDAAVQRATRSVRRDASPLLLMQGEDGTYFMSGFQGSRDVRAGATVFAVDPAVRGVVTEHGLVALGS